MFDFVTVFVMILVNIVLLLSSLSALSCSMNLFPTENYFFAAPKRVISSMQSFTNKMPAILALRVMLWLIHLFQVFASQIYKTILANGIV